MDLGMVVHPSNPSTQGGRGEEEEGKTNMELSIVVHAYNLNIYWCHVEG